MRENKMFVRGGYLVRSGAPRPTDETPIRTVGTGLPDGPPSDAGGVEETAAMTLPPSGREVARLSRNFSLRLYLLHREAVTEGACGWWDCILNFIGSLTKPNLYIIQSFYKT